MSVACACGSQSVAGCAGCGAALCQDHALGPRSPRPRHFRIASFADMLRDFPVTTGIDAGQMWAVRAEVAVRCAPDERCRACWEQAFEDALARLRPEPLPAYDAPVAEQGIEAVPAADLLAAWSAAARPQPLPDGVGTSRFRATKGWRLGPLEEDRLVRDGEGSVRVQVAVAYLTRSGEVWIPGRRLGSAAFPASWLPPSTRASSSGSAGRDPAPARQEALDRARARATAVLADHGWPV